MKGSVVVLISLLRSEINQDEYMNCNNVKIIKVGLPRRIYGFIFNYRNINIIIVNKYISKEKYDLTLLHEFAHLELSHLDKMCLNFKIEGIEDEADRYVFYLYNIIKGGEF